MNREDLRHFFSELKKEGFAVFGPSKNDGKVMIKEISRFEELDFSGCLPVFSFKRFFLPENQPLFEYKGSNLKELPCRAPKIALFGVNIKDLRSFVLYDQVFEKDPWYQERRKNIFVIGQLSATKEGDFEKLEEDILEHLSFDVFLARLAPMDTEHNLGQDRLTSINRESKQARISDVHFAAFTGSLLGRRTLDYCGFDDFIHIQFSGPAKEGGLVSRFAKIKENLDKKHNQELWDELGSRCIECGKCTIACPTCFCFRVDDRSGLEPASGSRERCWDSCFYQEFSEVSGPPRVDEHGTRVETGGHKFLNNAAKRIHFWYFHKFSRIPEEFGFVGCVGCHRCAEVCPVGIDIKEVLKEIERS